MRLTVTRKSRFGFQAEGHEGWFNADRNAAPDLEPIQVGMTIDAEVNGKYVRSFSIVSGSSEGSQTTAPSRANDGNITRDNNRNETITRLAVIRAVLTATSLFSEATRDRLIQKYVGYAMTGVMPSAPQADNNPQLFVGAGLTPRATTTIEDPVREGPNEVSVSLGSVPSVPVEASQRRRGRPTHNGDQ